MTKIAAIALTLMFLLSSCNSNLQNRIAQLEHENEILKKELLKSQDISIFEIVNSTLENQSEELPLEQARTLTESIILAESEILSSENENVILAKNTIIKSIDELEDYLVSISEYLIERNGGYNDDGWIKNPEEIRNVNEVMINMGKGEVIHSKLVECIKTINREIELTEIQAKELPLRYNLDFKRNNQLWHEFTFQNMPIGATIPIFTKLKNDCNASKYYILSILKEKL